MQAWQVGDVTISCVVEFKSPVAYDSAAPFIQNASPEALREIPWLSPHFTTPEGQLLLAVQALLVDAPGVRLVVDTCLGNDKPRRMTRNVALQTSFMQRLTGAGWTRESVDAVVCTHLHIDHIGWNTMRENGKWVPTFPRARYLIARQEYEFWSRDREDDEQIAAMSDSIQPILDANLMQLVEPDHAISPEVRLIPTPGHTPGHVSVLIESQGRKAVITGDTMHHPCQIARPDWCARFDTDQRAALATRRTLLADWADQPVLVIGTHFAAPTAGYVRRDQDTYRFDV